MPEPNLISERQTTEIEVGHGQTVQNILDEYPGVTYGDLLKANTENEITVYTHKSPDYKIQPTDRITVSRVVGSACKIEGIFIDTSKVSKYLLESDAINEAKTKSMSVKDASILDSLCSGNIVQIGDAFYKIAKADKTIRTMPLNDGSFLKRHEFVITCSVIDSNTGTGMYTSSQIISVSDYLKDLGLTKTIREGITLYIPLLPSGGLSQRDVLLDATERTITATSKANGGEGGSELTDDGTKTTTPNPVKNIANPPIYTNSPSGYSGAKDCFFFIYERGQLVNGPVYLPVIPQEFTDRNSVSYTPTNILGRSVAYQTYNNSSRSVQLSLEMHEELCDNYNYVPSVIRLLESVAYPGYETGQVNPCELELVVANHLRIRGVVDGVSTTWKTPMIEGRYVHAIVSFTITETTGPYSRTEIAGMGARRS